jgi:hypothetical protein
MHCVNGRSTGSTGLVVGQGAENLDEGKEDEASSGSAVVRPLSWLSTRITVTVVIGRAAKLDRRRTVIHASMSPRRETPATDLSYRKYRG